MALHAGLSTAVMSNYHYHLMKQPGVSLACCAMPV